MRTLAVTVFVLIAVILAGNTPAMAQQVEGNKETVEIGLSTDTIAITSGFRGTDLTVFGALDNADPLIQRQGRYDIVVILQGPERSFVVRRKDRYFGIWINSNPSISRIFPHLIHWHPPAPCRILRFPRLLPSWHLA